MTNRWLALVVILFSFIQFTLNWFYIVPASGAIVGDMRLALPRLGLVVGTFIVGYGIAHIPSGIMADRLGLRFALFLGVFVETLGSLISARAPGLDILLVGRFFCRISGSIYLCSAIGLTTTWFRDHELATANGAITGVASTAGTALGLYVREGIATTFRWRDALLLGGVAGAATFIALLFVFPTPSHAREDDFGGKPLGWTSFRSTFHNLYIWLTGASLLASYGSYFTAIELLPGYEISLLHASAHAANELSTILPLSGFIGGAIGGWCADRLFGLVPTIIGACCIQAMTAALIPSLGMEGVQVAAGIVGVFGTLSFLVWIAVPGAYSDRIPVADVPTASGLMLTIGAVGGVVMPALYGRLTVFCSPSGAWIVLGGIAFVLPFIGLLARQPIMKADIELKRT